MLEIPLMSHPQRLLLLLQSQKTRFLPTAFISEYKEFTRKLTNLYSDRFSLSSHITAFTETWLKPDILSCEVFPSSYTTYRHDRPTQHGGGVFIAVDSDLTSDILILEERNDIEFLGITLSSKYFRTFLLSESLQLPYQSTQNTQRLCRLSTGG